TINAKQDESISVTCDEVLKRGNYTINDASNVSIAHIRIVYKDYHLQELILNLLYSTTNVFCYSIDKKATKIFKEQMRNLSSCFTNVYVDPTEYDVNSSEKNTNQAHLSCMKLLKDKYHWDYVTTMQNHDIPIRTNAEMIEIMSILNGSNSIVCLPPIRNRIPRFKDWTFKALNLFKSLLC
uniref:L protein n=1 Tax=Syphacia muris TaxID=451379 RepID=A0A0N5AC40_9BILA